MTLAECVMAVRAWACTQMWGRSDQYCASSQWPSYTERSIVIMLALKTLKIVALVGIDLARILFVFLGRFRIKWAVVLSNQRSWAQLVQADEGIFVGKRVG